jgi:predicted RNA-binding Zn ribbon-like protein
MALRPFSFDAGRISLDLLSTLGDRSEERLPNAAALDAWLLASGLIEAHSGADGDDLVHARALRGAVFAVVDAEMRGEWSSPHQLAVINAAAALVGPAPRLLLDQGALRRDHPAVVPKQALGVIARDAIELLAGPDGALLRECEAANCSGIYVDRSRGGRRRWCSTARCGNRARVAAHRAKHAQATGTA